MCTEITESTGDGPPNKWMIVQHPVPSKVWECMAEILEDSGELSIVGEMEGLVNTYHRHRCHLS